MAMMLVTLREGAEYALALLLLIGVYRQYGRTLTVAAAAVIAAGALMAVIAHPLPGYVKNAYLAAKFWSFMLLPLLSLVSTERPLYPLIAVALIVLVPASELASVVLEQADLSGGMAYAASFLGALLALGLFAAGRVLLRAVDLRAFFGTDGVFVALGALCFVAGGVSEFDHSSVVTSVQQGFAAFFASFIPVLRAMLLMPGPGVVVAPLSGLWDYLTSQRVAMATTAVLLFLPPVTVFVRLLLTPEPELAPAGGKAERRKAVSIHYDELLRKGVPLLVSLLVGIVLLHAANLAARPSYDPEPLPVIPDGDRISVPLKDRFGDVSDGRIRKFTFTAQGGAHRFLVIMRPDGEVVAALDACEVCPPRGYVQRGRHVICRYCNTPIPIESLGSPGGCNPIPLAARVQGDVLTVSRQDIISAYEREAGKETGSVFR